MSEQSTNTFLNSTKQAMARIQTITKQTLTTDFNSPTNPEPTVCETLKSRDTIPETTDDFLINLTVFFWIFTEFEKNHKNQKKKYFFLL